MSDTDVDTVSTSRTLRREEVAAAAGVSPDVVKASRDEGDFLAYATRENIPSVTVNRLYEFLVDAFVLGGGTLRQDVEAEFNSRFERDLTPQQRAQLIR